MMCAVWDCALMMQKKLGRRKYEALVYIEWMAIATRVPGSLALPSQNYFWAILFLTNICQSAWQGVWNSYNVMAFCTDWIVLSVSNRKTLIIVILFIRTHAYISHNVNGGSSSYLGLLFSKNVTLQHGTGYCYIPELFECRLWKTR